MWYLPSWKYHQMLDVKLTNTTNHRTEYPSLINLDSSTGIDVCEPVQNLIFFCAKSVSKSIHFYT